MSRITACYTEPTSETMAPSLIAGAIVFIASPQAPTGNMRDLAESQYVDGEFIVLAGQMLDELSTMVKSSRFALNEPVSTGEVEPRRDDEVIKQQQAADLPDRSLGTLSLLRQIEWAKRDNRDHLYLGYWIDGHDKMDYKRRFRPLEAFDGRMWQPMREDVA